MTHIGDTKEYVSENDLCHYVEHAAVIGDNGTPAISTGELASMARELIERRASDRPSEEITVEEMQILDKLKRDNTHNGVRSVIESDFEPWFSLSERGLIAMEQHARGIIPHITRLGVRALTAALKGPREMRAESGASAQIGRVLSHDTPDNGPLAAPFVAGGAGFIT